MCDTHTKLGKYSLNFEVSFDFLDGLLELRQGHSDAVIGELVRLVVPDPSKGENNVEKAQVVVKVCLGLHSVREHTVLSITRVKTMECKSNNIWRLFYSVVSRACWARKQLDMASVLHLV